VQFFVFQKKIFPDCRGDFQFNITAFFEPYVRQWLVNTDSKTQMWVEAVCIHASYVFLFAV
jgi:hypothetical protein